MKLLPVALGIAAFALAIALAVASLVNLDRANEIGRLCGEQTQMKIEIRQLQDEVTALRQQSAARIIPLTDTRRRALVPMK